MEYIGPQDGEGCAILGAASGDDGLGRFARQVGDPAGRGANPTASEQEAIGRSAAIMVTTSTLAPAAVWPYMAPPQERETSSKCGER